MIAVRKLDSVSLANAEVHDPVLAALLAAPLAEEPESEEERAADLAAISEYQAGQALTYSAVEIHAEVLVMQPAAAE